MSNPGPRYKENPRVNPDSNLHKVLSDAAKHQFGPATRVNFWITETSNHGDSYHGFDVAFGRWIQVNLDNTLTPK